MNLGKLVNWQTGKLEHSKAKLVIQSSSLLVCLFLTACGFSPLYGNHGSAKSAEAQLAEVNVMVIQDAAGQALRNEILDLMPPTNATPRYQLKITMNESGVGIVIAQDATVTRQQMRNNLHAELFDMKTQKIIWREDMAATASYNVLSSQFSNLNSEEDARRRNLDELSQRVVDQLALFFNRPEDRN